MDYLRRLVSAYGFGRPWVDLRSHDERLTEPAAVTVDGVTAEVRATMTWQVTNEEVARAMAPVLSRFTPVLMRTAIRAVVSRKAWADLLLERERLVEDIRAEFAQVEKKWGITVRSFEILEIERRPDRIPEDVAGQQGQ